MGTLVATFIETANNSTDMTIRTGNVGPGGQYLALATGGMVLQSNSTVNAITVQANGQVSIPDISFTDLTATANVTAGADLTVSGGNGVFSAATSSLLVGAAGSAYTGKVAVGNSTVNSVVNSTFITVQNATDSSSIGPNHSVAAITWVADTTGGPGFSGWLEVPFACTIEAVTMMADASGSIVMDIWKDTYANFPPTDADSITASAVPTITTAQKSQDTTLTGWTTSIAAGDILGFNIDSVTTIAQLTLTLKVRKTG